MARSKHTSGMWETIDHNETPTIIANMDGWMEDGRMHYAYDVIAQCCDEHGDVLPNANANARLIEAAPDLLADLIDAVEALEEARYYPSKISRFKATIRRAKGAN